MIHTKIAFISKRINTSYLRTSKKSFLSAKGTMPDGMMAYLHIHIPDKKRYAWTYLKK